jgi:hypothetical protein
MSWIELDRAGSSWIELDRVSSHSKHEQTSILCADITTAWMAGEPAGDLIIHYLLYIFVPACLILRIVVASGSRHCGAYSARHLLSFCSSTPKCKLAAILYALILTPLSSARTSFSSAWRFFSWLVDVIILIKRLTNLCRKQRVTPKRTHLRSRPSRNSQ